MAKAEGAYALVILTRDAIYGVRDPWGLRPLVLGKLRGRPCAWRRKAAPFATDIGVPETGSREAWIQPGEIVRIDARGL